MKINDKVKIINTGKIYTTYGPMFKKLKFKNKTENYYDDVDTEKDIFTVFGKSKNQLLAIRSDKGVELLISEDGVKKVEESFSVSKEFILDLHNEIVWPSVKAKIEKEFPQLFEVKPIEMTVAEIEAKLGHSVKIVKG